LRSGVLDEKSMMMMMMMMKEKNCVEKEFERKMKKR
jgi:hypothetical protein